MGLSVTAEGIETGEMAEAMKEIGCHYLQGYYYSKPLPMEEFARKYLREPA
jgi:EAL domain-containing protein (putative c-di-GMP-specific phosphodiesterase class I)